ncbi:hypothetical protein COOONC_18726 [Cooperia oncophora]
MELVSDKDRKRLERHRSRWDQREKSNAADDWKSSKDRVEFPDEPMKQARFKEFLKYLRRGLVLPQPKELSVWEWESEKKEFEGKLTSEERGMLPEVRSRMKPLAKTSLAMPIQEMMQSKFTKETGQSGHAKHYLVNLLCFEWSYLAQGFSSPRLLVYSRYPHNSLAKRFNIPNPYPGAEIVGVPHLQRTSKKETLLNLGLPQTANDLAQRKAREEIHHEEELEKEAKEIKEEDLDRPPKSIFDVIFGESESDSDSDEEEEEEEKKDVVKVEQKEHKEEKKEEKEKEAASEQPKPKPITVMDIVDDEEEFGPAPPTSASETIPGFSVLSYLKDEIAKRKASKKSHKKHKSKKSKKEKSSKKSKKEKKSKKSRRKHHSSTSSSSDSSVIEVID